MNESWGPELLAVGRAGGPDTLSQWRESLCTAETRDMQTEAVLLSEKPLAEDPDHGESAGHEPFQEALRMGATGWTHG